MIKTQELFHYSEFFQDQRQIDVFQPESANGSCLLFIHGGGWAAGNKEQWHDVCRYFCRLGYVCASMSYRLVPEYVYPSQIEDVRLAMQFLKKNAQRFGYRPDSIAAIGSSAGGYLAVLLGLLSDEVELGVTPELEMRNTRPDAIIGYCPVVTLYTGRKSAHRLMGGTEEELPHAYLKASPDKRVEHIKGSEIPPYLLIQGDIDPTTLLTNTSKFCDLVNQNGGAASLVVLPGVKHGFGYGVGTDAQKQAIAHVELFLSRHGFH